MHGIWYNHITKYGYTIPTLSSGRRGAGTGRCKGWVASPGLGGSGAGADVAVLFWAIVRPTRRWWVCSGTRAAGRCLCHPTAALRC